ncbi:hypothetical protein [Acidovorax sp. sic0104]|uniref:hypothetical protein n=1 Tax=Acidovorax sp. sic0104 TaxID=2854784 RepID=UPI002103137B|nr:hypothetical protein [Acidovorax sp. sic0104]
MAAEIQVSANGDTVWVHSAVDGSTIGRFSSRFGLDVHRTASQQMEGAAQCLHCTHYKPTHEDWLLFCALMLEHHQITVDPALITIGTAGAETAPT